MSYVFKVQRPSHEPGVLISATRGVLEALDDLGLPEGLGDVRAALAHTEALSVAVREAPAHYEAVRDHAVRQLAAADITADAAIDAVVDAQRRAEKHGVGTDVLNRALRLAATSTWRTLVGYGDRLPVELLRPLVDQAVSTIATVAAALPAPVHDDATALAAGPKVREQWVKLTGAHNRWSAAHHLADQLRASGVLSIPAGVTVTTAPARPVGDLLPLGVFRFRRLDLATPPGPDRHPALALADDITAGAGPGLYTGPDVNLDDLQPPAPPGAKERNVFV